MARRPRLPRRRSQAKLAALTQSKPATPEVKAEPQDEKKSEPGPIKEIKKALKKAVS